MGDRIDGGEFARQAAVCRAMNAPFTARVIEAAASALARAPLLAGRIEHWPGARDAGAVALRVAGGLHALARGGRDRALAALYRDLNGDVEAVVADALAAHEAWLIEWIRTPPQTNEVARAAAIAAALLVVRERFAMPVELLEIGSSAGLLLNLARYGYDLGGVRAGEDGSTSQLAPEWRGTPPPAHAVEVTAAHGCDLDPLDVADPVTRERLAVYVWPDQPERLARMEAAVAIARAHPPRVERAEGGAWLAARLASPQAAGIVRVVFHSVALQYFPEAARAAVFRTITEAGARATEERPLAWIGFEWDRQLGDSGNMALRLATWPGSGTVELLAACHAHAAWIDWRVPGGSDRRG